MRQRLCISALLFAAIVLFCSNAYSCGFEFSFRSYLDKRFWQPFAKYEKSLGRPAQKDNRICKGAIVFAGTGQGGSPILQELRKAYLSEDFTGAKAFIKPALEENPSVKEREEILLVDAKIDMRGGEKSQEALRTASDKLISFLNIVRTPALRSEARGWLARVYYLAGNYSSAVKIYLDEFSKEDTIFSRESLITSLRMLFRYNGSSSRLADHLEEYFDTPAHALFAVTIVTNPIYFDEDERALMAGTAKKALDVLKLRGDLFSSGVESDALALALMRAALYMGDTSAAISYAQRIPAGSETADLPEFNWMVASSHFLQKDYAAAEAPLLRMYRSANADSRDRNAAAQALTGVYQKLGRGVDQLHASIMAERYTGETDENEQGVFSYWPADGIVFDLSYLLDVQLTDEELREYLSLHQVPENPPVKGDLAVKRAVDKVRYALAVRYARKERYDEAARLYEMVGHRIRTKRMREISELYSKTIDSKLPAQERLKAAYNYGAFLEKHSTQVFFNDTLWEGFQTAGFLGKGLNDFTARHKSFPPEGDEQGLTGKERAFFLGQERKLKDDQEERWRAYKILVSVAEEAGRSELGRKAIRKALKSLRLINTGRFGREEEIKAADKRLEKALALGYLSSEVKKSVQQ